jgi:hypothetical protein
MSLCGGWEIFFLGGEAWAWRTGSALDMRYANFTLSFCITTLVPFFDAGSVTSGMRFILNRTEETTSPIVMRFTKTQDCLRCGLHPIAGVTGSRTRLRHAMDLTF